MMHVVVDGYVDEPSSLGVPPYISPEARYLYGAIKAAGEEAIFLPVDRIREAGGLKGALPSSTSPHRGEVLFILAGALVPGRYLLTRPISPKEVGRLLEEGRRLGFETVLGGPITFAGGLEVNDAPQLLSHLPQGDLDHFAYHYLRNGEEREGFRNAKERELFSRLGAEVVRESWVPLEALVAEIETYRGCVRYPSHCSFCMERLYGRPIFRDPKAVAEEVRELHRAGVKNFRIGGQSCIISYGTLELGGSEVPAPNPIALKELFQAVRGAAPGAEVIHVDNANPEVISRHREKARGALEVIRDFTSDGNVLAFGLETADPRVAELNNLNTNADSTLEAIRLLNDVGREWGERGLPKLLPGINFLLGLPGESPKSYEKNVEFLKRVRREGLWVRRINVREVRYPKAGLRLTSYIRGWVLRPPELKGEMRRRAREFREWVRGFQLELLKEMFPAGHILRRAYAEIQLHGGTYLRQPGSYPPVLYVPYRLPTGRFFSCAVVDHSPRSLTVVEYPFPLKKATMKMLTAIPGVGKKRAGRILKERPGGLEELERAVEDPSLAEFIARISAFQ